MNDFGGIKTDIPGILISEDMNLRTDLITGSNDPGLQLRGQVLLENGRQNEFTFAIPGGTAFTAQTNFFGLPKGILLNATVINPLLGGGLGQNYVQLSLQKGRVAALRPFRILTNGYIADLTGLSWPPGTFQLPGTGPGIIEVNIVADPAPGANAEINTQGNTRWRLLSVSILLTADSNVANRRPFLSLVGASNQWAGMYFNNETVVATENRVYTWANMGVLENVSSSPRRALAALPSDMWFSDNPDIQIQVTAIQAGDQISSITWTRESLVTF